MNEYDILETPYAKNLIDKITSRKKEDGKIIDLLSSMEDVDIFITWAKQSGVPQEVVEALKMILGVSEQEGDFIEIEGIGKIDKSIAPFIKALNDHNYTTLACCSGLLKEHPQAKEQKSGYLSFLYDEKKSRIIQAICEELKLPYSEGVCYFKPAYTVRFEGETDKEIEQKWDAFQQKLNV